MPAEQTYVATYKVMAPGAPSGFWFKHDSIFEYLAFRKTVEPNTRHAIINTLAEAGFIEKGYQKEATGLVEYDSEADPAWVHAMKGVLRDQGIDAWNATKFDVKSPAAEGASVHIAKRKVIEAHILASGAKFEVSCATLHSDDACHLVHEI